MWAFWALLTALGFVSSLKRMSERLTERYCARRKLARVRAARVRAERERDEARERERAQRQLAGSAEEPALIYSSAPTLAPTAGGPSLDDGQCHRQPSPESRSGPILPFPVRQLAANGGVSDSANRLGLKPPPWPGLMPPLQQRLLAAEPLERVVLSFRDEQTRRVASR
jgi:hypothetical protein